jgi:hypothetical protein
MFERMRHGNRHIIESAKTYCPAPSGLVISVQVENAFCNIRPPGDHQVCRHHRSAASRLCGFIAVSGIQA